MSEVSRKIESTGGASSLHALLLFLVAFYTLLLRGYGGATGSLLKGHGP